MKFKKILTTAIAVFAAFGFLNACGSPGNSSQSGESSSLIEGVSLSQTSADMYVGDKLTLTATAASGATIEWSVSDETILSINDNGNNAKITALKAGSAEVTVTVGSNVATCAITVTGIELSLDKTTATVNKGETIQLTATCNNPSKRLGWFSSNTEVATVNSSGIVTGIMDGECDITVRYDDGIEATCHVTVVWANKPVDYYDIVWSEEVNVTNDSTFYYWNDQGWCGSSVIVNKAVYQNGAAEFSYEGSTAVWYGMQVFYKDPNVVVGNEYCLSTEITVTNAGYVTINGTVVELQAGVNQVEVYGAVGSTSFSLQCGSELNPPSIMEANDIKITKPVFTEFTRTALAAPTAISIADDKTITITDSNEGKNDGYTVAFCDEEGNIAYTQNVKSGDKIDDSKFVSGSYGVKAKALAKGPYGESPYSDILYTHVIGERDIEYDLEFSTAANGLTTVGSGVFFYWTEWEGVSNPHYANGAVTFDIVNGGNWYSNQIFYYDSRLVVNDTYTLHMTIETDVEDSITLNGTVIELQSGINEVEVEFVQLAGANPSITLVLGIQSTTATTITAGSFKLYDMSFTGATLDSEIFIG